MLHFRLKFTHDLAACCSLLHGHVSPRSSIPRAVAGPQEPAGSLVSKRWSARGFVVAKTARHSFLLHHLRAFFLTSSHLISSPANVSRTVARHTSWRYMATLPQFLVRLQIELCAAACQARSNERLPYPRSLPGCIVFRGLAVTLTRSCRYRYCILRVVVLMIVQSLSAWPFRWRVSGSVDGSGQSMRSPYGVAEKERDDSQVKTPEQRV